MLIKDKFFEGERPLFAIHNTDLENIKIYPGESALKECTHINAKNCSFMGKYPFWHNENTIIENCHFTVYARAAIWYGQNITMKNSNIEAPKMFRSIDKLNVSDTIFPNAEEFVWNCKNIIFTNVEMKKADYCFMNGENIVLKNIKLQGNYSFQDAKNVEIHDSYLDSKDAFWNTKNVTVYNSVVKGEYLGWHSKNLKFVNCTIEGTQALCYCENLTLENCSMKNTDLCFEYSSLNAKVNSHIDSIKNPRSGKIIADSIGEVIIDENCKPGNCLINEKEYHVS